MSETNLFRTIMIDFIPIGTTYSDLLAYIRGGTLESIHLYGPIGDATDFVTARVVYTEETGAMALYRVSCALFFIFATLTPHFSEDKTRASRSMAVQFVSGRFWNQRIPRVLSWKKPSTTKGIPEFCSSTRHTLTTSSSCSDGSYTLKLRQVSFLT